MEFSNTVKLTNKYGLHARPATMFVESSNMFTCDVIIVKDDVEINGKSIMGIMMLGAECGSTLVIKANGDDAEEAVKTLSELVESGFNEDN